MTLPRARLAAARRLLRTKSERETVERALDVVLAEEPILRAHRRTKGTGGFIEVFTRR